MGKEGEDMETTDQCARKRLEKELEDIYAHPPTNISFGPISDDIFQCQGIIIGPLGTPFEGCTFNLSIKFPIDYPFKPPKVQFLTEVSHPNISVNGTVDINILGDQWSSALTTEDLLNSISSILLDPIVQDPFPDLYGHGWNSREDEARGWKHNYEEHFKLGSYYHKKSLDLPVYTMEVNQST
ncbi:ubiquitin-conjugating enzyme 30 [Actinidia rufa]|uniref:Ubiquitin-conjugating enzyme 30 n=1 Tax=Actinidia rufa TaxID=165716 RepID=A0A7J0F2X0_9ERIC|nr:ubiquitin-conjugating enzyme 30 [Actinidia rufa]